MLRVFKYPETPDQDKSSNGALEFGLQEGKSLEPLPFYTNGNNSAIISFVAVEFDQFKKEVGRIDLDTALIDIDSTNNIYNVDGLTEYASGLENGIYRFEFQNDSNLFITEYFNVKDYVIPVIPIPELNYWPFLGNTDDIVGGNDGINFGATLVNDKAGNPDSAYDFERDEGDYMTLTNDANIGKLHSIVFRINFESVSSTTLLSKVSAINWVKFTTDVLCVYQNGSGNQAAFNIPTLGVTYYDFVFTRSGTEVKLYIDGTQQGGTQILPSDNDFILEALTSPTIQKVDGIIDNIRIYNRVITQSEIDLIHAEL